MSTTFIFAGGGTGGHLYPGIAIAREIARLTDGGARCVFVCSDRPLDARILSGEGMEYVPLSARPFSVRPKGLVAFMRNWGKSVRESRGILRRAAAEAEAGTTGRSGTSGQMVEGPTSRSAPLAPERRLRRAGDRVQVIALGGFVAAPVVQAARVERSPVTLVNLDAVPGKANQWIAKHAARVFTAAKLVEGRDAATTGHAGSAGGSKWEGVPPIVRREAMASGTPGAECRSRLGLDPARPTVLVTGGSQGARTINELMMEIVRSEPGLLGVRGKGGGGRSVGEPWQVLHQCGADDVEVLTRVYAEAGVKSVVRAFVEEMGDWWGAADLAIARAGAGNVGEVWANAVPTIFLPYPFHKDEHQRHNAKVLVDAGGAVVGADRIRGEKTLGEIKSVLAELLGNRGKREGMRAALRGLGPANGAERVARALLGVQAK